METWYKNYVNVKAKKTLRMSKEERNCICFKMTILEREKNLLGKNIKQITSNINFLNVIKQNPQRIDMFLTLKRISFPKIQKKDVSVIRDKKYTTSSAN